MEGKILKGAARGGLVELTRVKEEHLKRREQELQRRWARHSTAQDVMHVGRMVATLTLRRRQPLDQHIFCCACPTQHMP